MKSANFPISFCWGHRWECIFKIHQENQMPTEYVHWVGCEDDRCFQFWGCYENMLWIMHDIISIWRKLYAFDNRFEEWWCIMARQRECSSEARSGVNINIWAVGSLPGESWNITATPRPIFDMCCSNAFFMRHGDCASVAHSWLNIKRYRSGDVTQLQLRPAQESLHILVDWFCHAFWLRRVKS